jgi:hypothetical protein
MIWVEVQTLPTFDDQNSVLDRLPPGATPVSGLASSVSSIMETAGEQVQACIKHVAELVTKAVTDSGPQAWTVEFSIGFKGATAIPVIASGEATANLKVTLSWKQP